MPSKTSLAMVFPTSFQGWVLFFCCTGWNCFSLMIHTQSIKNSCCLYLPNKTRIDHFSWPLSGLSVNCCGSPNPSLGFCPCSLVYSHLCSQGEPLQVDIRLCPPPMAPTSVRVKAEVLTRPTRTCLTWPSVSSPFLPSHTLPQSLLFTPSCSWHLHRQSFIHILCHLMTSYIVYFPFLCVVSFVSL